MTAFQEGYKASIEITEVSKPFLRNFMFCPEFFLMTCPNADSIVKFVFIKKLNKIINKILLTIDNNQCI